MALKRHHIEELAELPEDRALEIHLDELCWARLAVWMRFGMVVLLGWAISAIEDPPDWRDIFPVLDGLLVLVYFWWRRRGLEERPFLRYGYVFLLVQLVLVRLAYLGVDENGLLGPIDFMLPALLLVFPLPFGFMLALYSVFWLPLALLTGLLGLFTEEGSDLAELLAASVYLAMCFGASRILYRRRIKAFIQSWQRARGWALEGRRMREELDQARRIQVSMLPQHDPYSPWLDIAGSSRPATEVGGDYYGFFDLGEDRQALVVADVAGHGVASGLLLAGVRGCLVMLHEDAAEEAMPAPSGLLARLNRVVRTVGGRRNFVTMIYCLFERSPPRLTLAAAGHPPLLRWRPGSGEIEEVLLPSLPLGTSLAKSFPETALDIETGDVFVFATDGIAEAVDTAGDQFGDDRLQAVLRRAAVGATAAEIRDALLAELETFLGDTEVQDDVTLVVVRVKS